VLCFTEASIELHLPVATGEKSPDDPAKWEYDPVVLPIGPEDCKGKLFSDVLRAQGLYTGPALAAIKRLCGQRNIEGKPLREVLIQMLRNPDVMGLRLVGSNHFHALVPPAAAAKK
jgi:hypothetical protein